MLVLETGIAGVHFHLPDDPKEREALLDKLAPGTEVRLVRDTDNIHDKYAISVYTMDGLMVGYISRFKNETIARLMDYGRRFVAYMEEEPPEPLTADEYRRTRAPTENYRFPCSIYMEI